MNEIDAQYKKDKTQYLESINGDQHPSIMEKDNSKSNRRLISYVQENFIDRMYDDNDRHMYIVLDPINHSYNPAKGVKMNKYNQ